jgi:hypothetical protein
MVRIKEPVDLFALCRRLDDSVRDQRRLFRCPSLCRFRLFLRLLRHVRGASAKRVESSEQQVGASGSKGRTMRRPLLGKARRPARLIRSSVCGMLMKGMA